MILIHQKEWDNESDLIKNLENYRYLIFGREKDHIVKFYSYELCINEFSVRIGIYSQGLCIKPVCFIEKSLFRLWIGFDQTVAILDLDCFQIISQFDLYGTFYEILSLPKCAEVIVIHELGAIKISSSGSICWSVDTDVVENFELKNDCIILYEMYGNTFRLSLETGMKIG